MVLIPIALVASSPLVYPLQPASPHFVPHSVPVPWHVSVLAALQIPLEIMPADQTFFVIYSSLHTLIIALDYSQRDYSLWRIVWMRQHQNRRRSMVHRYLRSVGSLARRLFRRRRKERYRCHYYWRVIIWANGVYCRREVEERMRSRWPPSRS